MIERTCVLPRLAARTDDGTRKGPMLGFAGVLPYQLPYYWLEISSTGLAIRKNHRRSP